VGVALAVLVGARAHDALVALERPLPATVSGVAELVGDPTPGPFGTRVELRIHGRRWQADVDRGSAWLVDDLLTGDHLRVDGRPRPLPPQLATWQRSRHLAGRLRVRHAGPGPPSRPWYGAANTVHRLLAAGSTQFGPDRRSLFLGLVLGDDRDQSDLARYRFRATGLGHLLAVSGQNVAFLLALARPVLERCGLRTRWLVGAGVLVVFVLVTRAEASVLRAAAMAAVALTAAASGRVASGARVLGLAVVGLLLVDPMLVWSTGFRLSVCATVGLLVGVRPLARRLPGPRWLAEALATTLAAQVATAPLLMTLSGGVPAVATVANVLAVPAAGLVMMLGLSTGLVAGALTAPLATVVNWPTGVLVGWVAGVAAVASSAPLPLLGPGRMALIGASVAGFVVLRRWWPRTGRVLAVLVAAAALVPVAPAVGVHRAAPGVELLVGPCGDRWVRLEGTRDAVGALSGLHALGVTDADVVVAAPVSRAAAATVAEQLRAVVRPPRASEGPCSVSP
jgi:competence protein ComEC